MRMIPNYFPEKGENSERTVYELLEAIDPPGTWFAFHSQNVASHHRTKQWSELDFVVVGPPGILVLEVKGGRVRCERGIWIGTDKFGKEHKKKESPFVQAKDGRYALQRALEEQLEKPALRGIMYGWGVVFPDISFEVESIEITPEQVADETHIQRPELFSSWLNNLYRFWKDKINFVPQDAQNEQLIEIVKALRPNFDLVPRLSNHATLADRTFVRMTEEQYLIMDAVEGSDRIICRGGAGTGKSFVALECARRNSARALRVLMVTQGRVFAEYLRKQLTETKVEVMPLEDLNEDRPEPRFDVLIVDEGQDLMTCEALDLLDRHLQNGLKEGRWRWFMDSNNQAGISGRFDEDAEKLLEGYSLTPLLLRKNVRNIKPIATQTQLVTGADIGVAENLGGGAPPSLLITDSEEGEALRLNTEIATLLNREGVDAGQIAIVSLKQRPDSVCRFLPGGLLSSLLVLDMDSASSEELDHKIVFSTVSDFKGLERKFVFVIDLWGLESLASQLPQLYVAMTRAQFGLWVFIPEGMQKELDDLKTLHAMQIVKRG